MRIDCTGSGLPTIVLDAGLGNDGLIWGGVQPVLAKTEIGQRHLRLLRKPLPSSKG
jgi:hypothetical protein